MQWLANVVVLRQLFRKLKIDFMIMNFFKPEKERTHYLLNRMVAVCQWAEKVRKSNDEILTAFNQSMKDLEKARVKLAQS